VRAARRGHVAFVTANTFEFDSRTARAADALAADGWDVTVVAFAAPHLPAEERRVSGVVVRRPPVDRRILTALRPLPGVARGAVGRIVGLDRDATALPPRGPTAADRGRAIARRAIEILAWRRRTGPWTDAVLRAAPDASVFVAKALVALPVVAAAARQRHGDYVYDVADLHVESGRLASLPGPLKARIAASEARLLRGASALLASTPAMADEIARRHPVPRPTAVLNVRPRWDPDAPAPRSDRLATAIAAAGAPTDRPIVLYHGAFRPDQGIAELVAALAEPPLRDAPVTAAFVGFGPLEAELRSAASSDPTRIVVLPAVPSDELLDWVAGASVVFVGAPPVTRNQRLTTPNKLFEAAMAGVPVVVAGGTYTASLVAEARLGRVVEPWTSAGIATTIAELCALAPSQHDELRQTIRGEALRKYNWEVEREALVARFRALAIDVGARRATRADGDPEPRGRRIALLLNNPFAADSRSWKLATSLTAAGWDVTVVARADGSLPGRESRDGFTVVRVAQPRPPGWLPSPRLPGSGADGIATSRGLVADTAGRAAQGIRYLLLARAWAAAIRAVVPSADVWQSEGLVTLPVALRLRSLAGGRVVYDSRDIHVQSARFARLPGPWRRVLAQSERRWAQAADAVVTVSEPYAAVLRRTLGVEPAIVMNGPVPWQPPDPPERRFHDRLGLSPETPVILYLGSVAPHRGVEELIAAITLVDRAALVVLGDGPRKVACEELAARSPAADRIFFLPAVPPDEILPFTASADVAAMPIQPSTLNHRLTTPTKLFDAMGAGVPVVASDLPGMAPIVRDTGCGIVCDPTNPADIARAIRQVVDARPERRAALRAACLAAARGPYAWERQVEALLDVYADLVARG